MIRQNSQVLKLLILPSDGRTALPYVEHIFAGNSLPHPLFSGHKQVASENLALRHQLALYARDKKRPRLHYRDRLFWIALKNVWKGWRSALEFVQPETVIGWQRQRFKRYWWRLSQPRKPGRPRVYLEIRKLVRAMAVANPIWGAPRIHGELLNSGLRFPSGTFRD